MKKAQINPAWDKLIIHYGHNIQLVTYGQNEEITVECTECNEVLVSEPRIFSQEELHSNYDGQTCPHCDSDNLGDYGMPEIEGDESLQKVSCNDCDSIWYDTYKFCGYKHLHVPKEGL